MVNRTWGEPSEQLHERHHASDVLKFPWLVLYKLTIAPADSLDTLNADKLVYDYHLLESHCLLMPLIRLFLLYCHAEALNL